MRRKHAISTVASCALAALLGAAGCQHARKIAGDPRTEEAQAEETPRAEWNPRHPLVVDAPSKLLRPGAGRKIQEELEDAGYLRQPDLEALGEPTVEALRRFQRGQGLAATGFPDAETLRRLDLDPRDIYLPYPSRPAMEAGMRQEAREKSEAPPREDEGAKEK